MKYDAFDRAVEKNVSGTFVQTLYSPIGKLAMMLGQTVNNVYLPLPGGAQARYTSSAQYYYRHTDWLGSSRFASTTSRGMYSDTAYAPYGEDYSATGAPDAMFTGQNENTVSGTPRLYDFQFRRYSEVAGRWLSADPAGLAAVDPTNPQTLNRYAYVMNSPLNFTDPLGLYTPVTQASPCSNGTTLTVWIDWSTSCEAPCPQGYIIVDGLAGLRAGGPR